MGTYGIAGVDVGAPLEEFEDFFQVSAPGGPQEARAVVGLQERESKKMDEERKTDKGTKR